MRDAYRQLSLSDLVWVLAIIFCVAFQLYWCVWQHIWLVHLHLLGTFQFQEYQMVLVAAAISNYIRVFCRLLDYLRFFCRLLDYLRVFYRLLDYFSVYWRLSDYFRVFCRLQDYLKECVARAILWKQVVRCQHTWRHSSRFSAVLTTMSQWHSRWEFLRKRKGREPSTLTLLTHVHLGPK